MSAGILYTGPNKYGGMKVSDAMRMKVPEESEDKGAEARKLPDDLFYGQAGIHGFPEFIRVGL